MNEHVNDINHALLLRKPQLHSLEILAWVADNISLDKDADWKQALATIKAEYPKFRSFERNFPSLCFNLATGVGKTRLMGAAIAYLYAAKGMKNFFILAPNLTIYNKLITDFTYGSPKYVFHGLPGFTAQSPEIIKADNYENRGEMFAHKNDISINIFNISKITEKEKGSKKLLIKKTWEVLGSSYFKKLAEQDDLVLLMDEAHHYRASAGMKAIEELKPVLGIELTATPYEQKGDNKIYFENIIYEYQIAEAMEHGFVKEPIIVTDKDFKIENHTEDSLEKLKLEDGIFMHEKVKIDLEIYAKNEGLRLVRPFMLVIAKDTSHADKICAQIKSNDFFDGRYKDKILPIHSNKSGVEKEDARQDLDKLEEPENDIEIVIHVNMLKEGWDVTNLYTIVPLRTADSFKLVEQSIGRGLRLPYGARTGVKEIDGLNIIAHDRFDKIIRDAKDKESIFRKGLVIGEDIETEKKELLEIKPNIDNIITKPSIAQFSEEESEVAVVALEAIKNSENLPITSKLNDKNVQQKIVKYVQAQIKDIAKKPNILETVKKAMQVYINNTIDIPYITCQPKNPQNYKFKKFSLDKSKISHLIPATQEKILQAPRTGERHYLQDSNYEHKEGDPKACIIEALCKHPDISYDAHADSIHDLAEQAVAHILSYIKDETALFNIVNHNRIMLADNIHAQMQTYYEPSGTIYEECVASGVIRLKTRIVSCNANETQRSFRDNVKHTDGVVFYGFKKCLHPLQKFDSKPEHLFSELLESEPEVMKWCKPALRDLFIPYLFGHYNPDFVVETDTDKWLCEIKAKNKMDDPDVVAKADAAIEWCKIASEYERQHSSKAWNYALIGHDKVKPSANFRDLVNQ